MSFPSVIDIPYIHVYPDQCALRVAINPVLVHYVLVMLTRGLMHCADGGPSTAHQQHSATGSRRRCVIGGIVNITQTSVCQPNSEDSQPFLDFFKKKKYCNFMFCRGHLFIGRSSLAMQTEI